MYKKVLTIQDISCVGQCSLTVASPVISAMGIETCILPSAILSTQTADFNGYTFRDLTEDLPAINAHWTKENIKFDYFYTGYIGSIKQLDYIMDIMDSCAKEDSQIIIDPVMADNGNLYKGFDKNFANAMADFCHKADVILPNLTEAALLLNEEYVGDNYDESYIVNLLKKLAKLGPKNVVITGVSFEKSKLGIATYDSQTEQVQYYFRNKVNKDFHGTGDLYASTFVGGMALGYSIFESATLAVDFTMEAINKTIEDPSHWYGVKFEPALPYLINRVVGK
jgi:pyridoxine kinase